jgi:hypothetical protein
MISQFFLEIRIKGQSETVKNPIDITLIYLKTNFAVDFITMIPL